MPNRYLKREIIYPIGPSIAYIQLTRGLFSLIDVEDSHKLIGVNWCAFQNKAGNIYTYRKDRKRKTGYFMHRIVMNVDDGFIVDHKNGNGLDNRKSNLRQCTYSQNIQNSRLKSANSSGYKGVYWNKYVGRWHASICSYGKRIHIDYFDTAEEAHQAYCIMAEKVHGEFAKFN